MAHLDLSTIPIAARVFIGLLIAIQITLDIIALRDLYKRPVNQVVFANKWSWVAIVIFGNLLGPILYLAAGRKQEILTDHTVSPRPPHTRNIADVLYGPRDNKDKN